MTRYVKGMAMVVIASGWLLASTAALEAQTRRLSIEGRPGVTLPSGDLADANAGNGLSLAAEAMYSFSPVITGYIGLSQDRFDCDGGAFCDEEITSSGVQGGFKFLLRRDAATLPWLRAGLVGQTLDLGNDDSDMALGLEGAAGIDFDVTPNFTLVPALHVRGYEADFGPGDRGGLDVRYFTASLGAHLHF